MKVCISEQGEIQCMSDTCTSYCPKFEECFDVPTTLGTLMRELLIESIPKPQNGGE